MADRAKIISAIEKAKKQSEEYAQDRIIVPFREADMILALLKEQDIDVKEASKNINNQDPIVALRAAIVCTNSHDEYSVGFRNGIRYAISVLTGKEPKYEDVT